ncbi:MAG: hypothetical protein RL147_1144 [Actinomycetota bacterium]|jgi:uncharacterized protein YjbI with pentapeptide repeats
MPVNFLFNAILFEYLIYLRQTLIAIHIRTTNLRTTNLRTTNLRTTNLRTTNLRTTLVW